MGTVPQDEQLQTKAAFAVSAADVVVAHARIAPFIHRTPLLRSTFMDTQVPGASFLFKAENLQKSGSFKIRGALNALLQIRELDPRACIVTHSSGNHAQAVALAAKMCDMRAVVVMPSSAPQVKISAVRDYGAEIAFCEPNLHAREAMAASLCTAHGAHLVHPFNDARVMAGQGTVALEMLADAPGLEAVVIPIGGGGLIGGMSVYLRGHADCLIVGAEPELAGDAYESKKEMRVVQEKPHQTIADGLRTALGDLTRPIVQEVVDEIVLVTEDAIRRTLRDVLERMKTVIEPSAAVPVAAAQKHARSAAGVRSYGVVLCGGNLDLDAAPWRGA